MNLKESKTGFLIESTIGIKHPEAYSMDEELTKYARMWVNIQKENPSAITNYYPASFHIGCITNEEKEPEKCVKVSVLLNPYTIDLGLDVNVSDIFFDMLSKGGEFPLEKISKEVQIILTYFANLIGANTICTTFTRTDMTYTTDLQNLDEAHIFNADGKDVTPDELNNKYNK